MSALTFPNVERLKSRKIIATLFDKNSSKSFSQYPIRVVWVENTLSEQSVQIAFSVPKRAFKRAVARNRIRRLMQETYRLNKESLHIGLDSRVQRYSLMLIYVAKEELPYTTINEAMRSLMRRFVKFA
jgi:ribonuclease P protein component